MASTSRAVERAFDALRERSAPVRRDAEPRDATVVLVGTATCGRAAGAGAVVEVFEREIRSQGLAARVIEVGCLGHCYAEPMVVIRRPGLPSICYGSVGPGVAETLVKNFIAQGDPCFEFILGALEENDMVPPLRDQPRFRFEHRALLARCGLIDPPDILHAVSHGAYAGLARALRMPPEEIIETVRRAGLRGLGGAGFPTWRKWDSCRATAGREKHIICNADEGDPGAFMDRAIIESDPHAVIEGMIIAGLAVGTSRGHVYVRAEYPLAVDRLEHALGQARAEGLLGPDILGSGKVFTIEVAKGAGAFVCGESSALMYSIEGRRGMPRVRPPQSIESGLWGRPTVLNNVKTFAAASLILRDGPEAFARVGTETSKGTAVFALAGKVVNTGLVEVPMGTRLRDLVETIGGGVPHRKKLKAVQIGGPSGGCLPESQLDTAVDFEALDAAGAMMGSGGMVVLDEDNCTVETARFFLDFTQRESCGKCTFCRLGTKQMLEILDRFVRGEGALEDLDLLAELAEDVRDGSLCNLGRTAPNPILTTLRYFRDEYEAHILEQRCPARVCTELSTYYILPDKCELSCDACVGSCPTEAIYTGPRRIKVIDQADCIKCGSCMDACPPQYKAVAKISPLRDLPNDGARPKKKSD